MSRFDKERFLETITDIQRITQQSARLRESGRTVAFVPTMGALHRGHLSLVESARSQGHCVVASIFVNPLQFGKNEDFFVYPRSFEEDEKLLSEAGVEVLFAPEMEKFTPAELSTSISVGHLAQVLEGRFRPGHFDGVCTIVWKLLSLVQPHVLFLGEKDFQQVRVLQQCLLDLNSSVKVAVARTVREPDGLALSSRNRRLDAEAREKAPGMFRALSSAVSLFRSQETKTSELVQLATKTLQEHGFDPIQYVEICDAQTLLPQPRARTGDRMLMAAYLNDVRLIDNMELA